MTYMWTEAPARFAGMARTALTLLLLLGCYVVAAVTLIAIATPRYVEAVALGLLWTSGALAAVILGYRHAAGKSARQASLVAVSVIAVGAAVCVTPFFGPSRVAALMTVAGWGAALVGLTVPAHALMRSGRRIAAMATALVGGSLLVLAAPFLSARLQLPPGQVSWASLPWWLPVAVTDQAMVDSVNRLDAIRVAFGAGVLLTLGTAYVLAYVVAPRR
jgi:hypothetical protein